MVLEKKTSLPEVIFYSRVDSVFKCMGDGLILFYFFPENTALLAAAALYFWTSKLTKVCNLYSILHMMAKSFVFMHVFSTLICQTMDNSRGKHRVFLDLDLNLTNT